MHLKVKFSAEAFACRFSVDGNGGNDDDVTFVKLEENEDDNILFNICLHCKK